MTFPADASASLRALIVGAAGSAGQSFARALLRLGIDVIAADHDEIGLARLRNDLGCAAILLDALDDTSVAELLDHIDRHVGAIDLLINVAGRGYVRTLAMMRVSRAFSARSHANAAYIVNVGRPSDPDEDIVSYAGSEVAFDRLSQGLSETLGNDLVRVLTLPRLESDEAYADISERLCGELRRGPTDRDAGGRAPAAG